MTDDVEAVLVEQVRLGDQRAFAEILAAHLGPVNRYVYRMTANTTEAEDITQEVFLRLWTQAGRFDPQKSKLSTWLHNIAHNLCVDHFRKNGRMVSGDPAEETGGDEPEASLIAMIEAEDIKAAVMQLPERQRSALLMCHYQGLSNKEVAEILDISVSALESLLARARRTLKTLLANGGSP